MDAKEIKAKRAELAKKRKLAAEAKQAKLDALCLEDEMAIDELDNPKARLLYTEQGVFAVVSPSEAEYQSFSDLDDDDKTAVKVKEFLTPCIVYPSMSVVDQRLTEQPGLIRLLSNKVMEAAGAIKTKSGSENS